MMKRHGLEAEIPLEALLSDDPDAMMVFANMSAWVEVHGCRGEKGEDCGCVEDEDCENYGKD